LCGSRGLKVRFVGILRRVLDAPPPNPKRLRSMVHKNKIAGKLSARTIVLVLTVALAAAPGMPARAADSVFVPTVTRRLDAGFRTILRTHRLPSVAAGVWRPGKAPYIFVGGSADLRTAAARSFRRPFRIASITKAFVAVAVLQLIEAGTLRKADRMSRWYPQFPNASSITIDDLLRMRSGIAAPDDNIVLAKVYDHPLGDQPTVAEQIAEAAALRAAFIPPDTKGVYTDLNYFVLGEIVRRVTGRDIGYYITRGIIDKLELRQTSYPTASALPGGLHGYGWNPVTRRFDDKTLFNPALAGAAGAMILLGRTPHPRHAAFDARRSTARGYERCLW
jgi:D-alanyl-D-alanine carboxypeptidase